MCTLHSNNNELCVEKEKRHVLCKMLKKFCLFSNLCAALVCHELLNELQKKHYVSYHQFAEFVIAHIPSFHIPNVISLSEKKFMSAKENYIFCFSVQSFLIVTLAPCQGIGFTKKICLFISLVCYLFFINISLYLFAY